MKSIRALKPTPRTSPPLVETRFVRLLQAVPLGHRIDGWRVCWLGGWDRGRLFYVVMLEKSA